MKQQSKGSSIEKALAILLSFTPYNEEMGTLEISKKLGLHKATTSRIIHNLMRHGFIIRNSKSKKFILGPSVMDLARAITHSFKSNVIQTARPHIDDLRSRLGETVILEVLSGQSTFMAYIAETSRLTRLAGSIGDRVPIHASAGAKTILAYSSKETRDFLLPSKLHRFTDNTITDKKELLRQLEEIRQNGIAFDVEEIDEGTSAVGAPLLNYEGKPVGAVVVAGPSQRIPMSVDSPIAVELKKTASKISRELLYRRGLSSMCVDVGQ